MKRSRLKLLVRRETLRMLAGVELVRVGAGGSPGAVAFDVTGGCPKVFDSAGAGTGCPLPAKP